MSSIGYTYSYSGADCKTFAFFPGVKFLADKVANIKYKNGDEVEKEKFVNKLTKPIFLDSLATVSISVHEAKSPVRRLGERGVAGYSRGIRTIAGTMVFVVVEDHPLRKLAIHDPANVYEELIGWSRDLKTKGVGSISGSQYGKGKVTYNNKVATLISPVNIVMHYQTEVGFIKDKNDLFSSKKNINEKIKLDGYTQSLSNGKEENNRAIYKPPGASMMLEGVEFINEGIVTSVNDMVTEVVVQFVAQDFTEFTYTGDTTDTELNNIIKLHGELAKDSSKTYRSYYEDLEKKKPTQNSERFGSTTINIDGYNG